MPLASIYCSLVLDSTESLCDGVEGCWDHLVRNAEKYLAIFRQEHNGRERTVFVDHLGVFGGPLAVAHHRACREGGDIGDLLFATLGARGLLLGSFQRKDY